MQFSPYNGLGFEPVSGQTPFGNNQPFMQNVPMQQQSMQQPVNNRPVVDPRTFETPNIVMGNSKPLFSTLKDNTSTGVITVDNSSDYEKESKKRKSSGKKKESTTSIVRANDDTHVSGTVEDPKTIYSYQETNGLLHETLGQIDAINSELVQEFNAVRHNRTMKNKYMVLNNLSENIGSMLSNRISTIKEINNCISKANDLDYKKYKDIQAAQGAMNDDKYIADLYQSFMQNSSNQIPTYQLPTNMDTSVLGSSIIRANIPGDANNGSVLDSGYLNYISNLTPEQNLMRYESDPNVKQVVIYDASTGAKFFQMMNVQTGEAIPNLPVYDQNIMEDTTLDINNKVAKNLNLRESFPIIIINDNITSQY